MHDSVLNVSAYRFVALADPPQWRALIHGRAQALGLRGTVLLAEEGINLVVAGEPGAVRAFMGWLNGQPPFDAAPLDAKESFSAEVPFRKLVVKVKREIIRMNQTTVRPQAGRAPSVPPDTLARWLDAGRDDAGRPVVLLDTRNGFEVDHGRFRGAVDWRLAKFSDFPAALARHRDELQGKTVVTYCTGGIRCEKAALWMADAGVENTWQLEGGILRYFERQGGTHFEGLCFVFDGRESLDDTLSSPERV